VRPGLRDGHVADLEVLVGVAGDAPVHDALHPEQAQQQLGCEPCIQLQCRPQIDKSSIDYLLCGQIKSTALCCQIRFRKIVVK